MPGRLKVSACLALGLAVVFGIFFQVSKHHPALSPVNAFADDPYDSVGSIGVQLALFTALLSLIRAFRPYEQKKAADSQKVLLVHGASLCCVSVGVTAGADVIAMLRYPSVWIGFQAGQILAALLGGLILLTALVGWHIHYSARKSLLPSPRNGWRRALVLSLVSILVFALYPANWGQSIPGAIITALTGTALFFVLVWAWGRVVAPSLETHFEDCIDDLAAILRWLKAHIWRVATSSPEYKKKQGRSFSMLNWLNPRKHAWNSILLIGIFLGILLAFTQITGEGGPFQLNQVVLVAGIFIGFEGSGVLVGYALLAKPLGLFRHDSSAALKSRYR